MNRPRALFSSLLERAWRRAARSHQGHRRKSSDLPYIVHPSAVAAILIRAGLDDEELLAAALLHDVVEDTPCTLDDLRREFPANVVRYVAALTERKHDEAGRKRSWRDRKEEHLREIAHAPRAARAIALADKLHNLAAMLYDLDEGDRLWSRFNAPPEDILWYHRRIIEQAQQDDPALKPLADECRRLIDRLQRSIG